MQASKQRLFEATAGCKFELFSLQISIFSNNLRSGKAPFFCNFSLARQRKVEKINHSGSKRLRYVE
jgi:hypothetical protein